MVATSATLREVFNATLAKIRKRIKRAQSRSSPLGEQNTKSTLIDPILTALGWDLEEFDEVRREYKRKPQDNPVDYALFVLRSPRLFIEAKDLSKTLDDRKWISQTLGYATVVGVEWCVLTNGNEYRIYNSHATVDVEEKLFRLVKITDAETQDFTLDTLALLSKSQMGENQLEALWKAHFIDRQIKSALERLFQNQDTSLARLIRKQTPRLKPAEIRESLKRAEVAIDFPALRLETMPQVPKTRSKKRRKRRRKDVDEDPTFKNVRLGDLVGSGLVAFPLALERRYKGAKLEAVIDVSGQVVVDGMAYTSPSTAAGMARKKIIGARPGRKYPQTNGWTFWKYRDPASADLKELNELRKQFVKSQR